MKQASGGGGFTAGHCMSCSAARSPSPTRHTLGNDGKIYNYIAHDEKGRVDMPLDILKQQRPMSASSAPIAVRRNPHPSVQSAALATLARNGPFSDGSSV